MGCQVAANVLRVHVRCVASAGFTSGGAGLGGQGEPTGWLQIEAPEQGMAAQLRDLSRFASSIHVLSEGCRSATAGGSAACAVRSKGMGAMTVFDACIYERTCTCTPLCIYRRVAVGGGVMLGPRSARPCHVRSTPEYLCVVHDMCARVLSCRVYAAVDPKA